MRAVVVFLLFLCFLFLRGYSYAYAHAHHNKICYSPAQNLDKTRQGSLGASNLNAQLIKNNTISEKKLDLISVEDEDDDLVFARKYVVLVNYFITIAYTLILCSLYRQLRRLPICRNLISACSNKYIVNRVLKI